MSNDDILKTFYNCIVEEAVNGRVDVFSYYNISFYTTINTSEGKIEKKEDLESKYPGVIVPVLEITNKELFDSLLVTYVNLAREFYDDSNFMPEVLSNEFYEETKMISKEKCIMCFLISNMSTDDFSNPIAYLRQRISFLKNHLIKEDLNLGYIPSLESELVVKESQSRIYDETPYELNMYLKSDVYNETYELPSIRIGIDDDKVFIYAIQSRTRNDKNDPYFNFLYDKLKRIDKGFTLSFIVPAMVSLGLFRDKEVIVEPYLIERWNAKRIAMYVYKKVKELDDSWMDVQTEAQIGIQENLTDKFLRIFERIIKHCEGIDMTAYPYLIDGKMHIEVQDKIVSNREVLQDLFDVTSKELSEEEKRRFNIH